MKNWTATAAGELSHDNILIQSGVLITPYIPSKILFPIQNINFQIRDKPIIEVFSWYFNKVFTVAQVEYEYLLNELHSQLNVWQVQCFIRYLFYQAQAGDNRSDGVKIGNNKN